MKDCNTGRILGNPDSEYEYEFQVVLPREDGNFDWVGNYTDANAAGKEAAKANGAIVHNVRIQGRKRRAGKAFTVFSNAGIPVETRPDEARADALAWLENGHYA